MEIFFYRAETDIHVGAGQSTGTIDLPVMREKSTGIPIIPGSGMKGALRQWAAGNELLKSEVRSLFGPENKDNNIESTAGNLLISDGRLLFLPIRMLEGSYKLVTCPFLLKRFGRDCARAGRVYIPELPDIDDETVYMTAKPQGLEKIYLEEMQFDVAGDDFYAPLSELMPKGLADKDQLALISDDNFIWFANHALPVHARNKLNSDTKASENLWYEETLPPETILYNLFGSRSSAGDADKTAFLSELNKKYIIVGGNETIGQGWLYCTKTLSETEGQQ